MKVPFCKEFCIETYLSGFLSNVSSQHDNKISKRNCLHCIVTFVQKSFRMFNQVGSKKFYLIIN